MSTRLIVALKLCALGALVAGLAAVLGAGAPHARASFPGANGKIAFYSNRDGNNEIYVMNADGTNPTNLTNNPADDGDPAFSPDGTKIAFFSGRDGNSEIYVMNADGTGPVRLTNDPAQDLMPDWQPLLPATPTPTPTATATPTPTATFTPTSVRPPVNPDIDKTVNGQQGPITVTLGDSVTYRWVVTGDRLFFATVDDDTHDALDGECPFAPCERTAVVTLLTPGPVTNTSRVVACGIPPWPDRCKAEFDQDSVTVNVVTSTPTSTPPPPPIGGSSLDPPEVAAPLRTSEPSGPSVSLLATVALAVALALGGAAWYARRR